MPRYGGAVAPPDARPGIPALRRARRRLRGRRHDIHGAGRPSAHARHSPVQPGSGAVYRARVAAAVAAEQAYLAQYQRWRDDDRGYGAIQSTRPQTLSYGLNDSPAGLAAWVLEKWRGWADSGGDIDATFSRDFLLTVVTLYWATQTIASSIRDYVDNRRLADELSLADVVTVPTAVAVFHQFIDDGTPPREWAERLYNIRRWTPMPSGGHFPAAEVPGLLSHDIAAFFNDLTERE